MNVADIARLKALAEAATPGPWVRTAGYRVECHALLDVKYSGQRATWSGGTKIVLVAETGNGHLPGINAEFLAAANPAVVLDLLADLAAARALLAEVAAMDDAAYTSSADSHDLMDRIRALLKGGAK